MPTTRPFEGIDNQVNVAEYDLIPLLATAKKLVNESEFVSKADATKRGCRSTADRVQEIYRNTVNNLSYIDIKGFSQKIQNLKLAINLFKMIGVFLPTSLIILFL